jgi:hypothetical protein
MIHLDLVFARFAFANTGRFACNHRGEALLESSTVSSQIE